jgi:hypothetical protein
MVYFLDVVWRHCFFSFGGGDGDFLLQARVLNVFTVHTFKQFNLFVQCINIVKQRYAKSTKQPIIF